MAKTTSKKGKKPVEDPGSSRAQIQRAFAKATKELSGMLRGRDAIYRIPWFAMIGEPSSGKDDLIQGSGLVPRPGSPHTFGATGPSANRWWMFNNALLIDFSAGMFGSASRNQEGGGGEEQQAGFFRRMFRRDKGKAVGAWRANLEALRKNRMRRPLDGMVLCIDAASLIKRTPDAAGQIARRAELMAERIQDAQQRLGVHFPIYVVVTGCDSMPGFSVYARALPEPVRDQMFGWSSPHDPEQNFQLEWIDEAIGSIHESVSVTQLDLLPKTPDQNDRDALYLLPRDVQQLRDGLRAYLEPIFKSTSFRKGLPLRGIYLTAQLSPPAPAPEKATPPGLPPLPGEEPRIVEGPPPRPVFVRQLFSEKIFQEPGLSVLDEEHSQSVRKTVRRARLAVGITAAVGGLLLWYQHSTTSRRVEEFKPLHDLMEVYQSPATARKAMSEPGGGVKALETLAELKVTQFEIFTAPTSYFLDDLTTRTKAAIAQLLGQGVAKPLMAALYEKSDRILPPALDGAAPKDAASALVMGQAADGAGGAGSPSGVPSGKRDIAALARDALSMREFAENVAELRGFFDLYNRHQPDDLAKVYKFVTDRQKDLEAADSDSALFREALLNTSAWPKAAYERYSLRARNRFIQLAEQFHTRQFRQHPLRESERRVVDLIDTIEARKGLESYFERLRAIRGAIGDVETLIDGEQSAWLLPDEFATSMTAAKYDDLIALLDGGKVQNFPPAPDKGPDGQDVGLGSWFRETNQRLYTQLKEDVFGQTSRLGGFPVVVRKDIRVVLSEDLDRIKVAIDDFLSQPYIITNGAQFQSTLQRDAGLRQGWNTEMLKQVLSWHLQYKSFVDAKRDGIPAAMTIALKTAAHRQFRDRAMQILEYARPEILSGNEDQNAAWTAQRRDLLKERVRNLSAEQPNIQRVINALNDVNASLNEPADNSLFNALRDDANGLLEQVDSVLESEKLYTIRSDAFSWWEGDQPPGVVAFGARDPNDLLARLTVQQKAVSALWKDYARPLVDFMLKTGEPFTSDPDVDKWRKIGQVLDEYEKKVPGNSLEELERFVEDELNKLRLATCAEQLEKHKDRFNRDDYFKDRKFRIALDMERRCADILKQVTVQGYVDLQQFFADKLQGRFPFAGPDVPAEVESGDLVEFYRRFDRYSGAFSALISDEGVGSNTLFGKATGDVRRFVSQINKVRPLFANLLTAEDENPTLVLDISFEFRVNQENEVNGNQIIEWWAQVGEERISHRDNKTGTQWRSSDQVGVCLRWARDAMFIPAANQRSEQARINGRQVCYVFSGRWALLRLLTMHAATPADRGRRSFLRPHTLRFETETSLASAQRSATSLLVTDTRVYVQLGVMLPGAKSEYKMPEFPRRAPELTTEFLRQNGIVAKGGSGGSAGGGAGRD